MWSGRKKKKSTRGRSTLVHLVRSQEDGLGLDYTLPVYAVHGAFLADLFFYQFGRTILQGIFREKLLGLPLCAMG